MASLEIIHLGLKVPYRQGMLDMQKAMSRVAQANAAFELLLLEHADTITTTRAHAQKSLIASTEDILSQKIDLIETDRGGDVTFHGKGQLVGYPIFQLAKQEGPKALFPYDLTGYLRKLEHALLKACFKLGVPNAHLRDAKTGVWVSDPKNSAAKKLIAIGVGCSSGITRHGFALNITTDLARFTGLIVPCGLHNMGVTSLVEICEENGTELPDYDHVCDVVCESIRTEFNLSPHAKSIEGFVTGETHGRKYCDAPTG